MACTWVDFVVFIPVHRKFLLICVTTQRQLGVGKNKGTQTKEVGVPSVSSLPSLVSRAPPLFQAPLRRTAALRTSSLPDAKLSVKVPAC